VHAGAAVREEEHGGWKAMKLQLKIKQLGERRIKGSIDVHLGVELVDTPGILDVFTADGQQRF
jgi:hypothetical protein